MATISHAWQARIAGITRRPAMPATPRMPQRIFFDGTEAIPLNLTPPITGRRVPMLPCAPTPRGGNVGVLRDVGSSAGARSGAPQRLRTAARHLCSAALAGGGSDRFAGGADAGKFGETG